MRTGETALFNVNMVISTKECRTFDLPCQHELPNDDYVANIIAEGLTAFLADQGLDLLSVSVVFRTGELG